MNRRKRKVGKMNEYEFNLEDRISTLPDDVLVSIISLLTLKEAVACSTLSRRWGYVCNSTMNLNFDARYVFHTLYPETPRNVRKDQRMNFFKWVNRVLTKHEGPKIEQFRVCFDLDNAYKYHIDRWIKFAMEKRVQKLELDFLTLQDLRCSEATFYTFPQRHFRLKNIGFESLKVLNFMCVEVSDQIFEQFLSKCPLLERLTVWESPSLCGVRVDSPSLKLKHLEIKTCLHLGSIKVSCAPNLVSFYFDRFDTCLTLGNVPKLVELSMYSSHELDGFIKFAFDPLLCCLHQLEILKIDMVSKKFENDQVIPMSTNLKHLQLGFDLQEDYCFGLLQLHSFIKAFPYLQRLVLVLKSQGRESTTFAKAPTFYRSSIKVVEILGYSGSNRDVEFVIYIMKNIFSLERLVIDPRIYGHYPLALLSAKDIEMEKKGRAHAMEKLKPIVRKTIEFVCL